MNPRKWKRGYRIAAACAAGVAVLAAAAIAFDPLLRVAQNYWPENHEVRLFADAMMGATVGVACVVIAQLFRVK